MIQSRDWQGNTLTLVNEVTGCAVQAGDVLEDFRGDPVTVTGGKAPHKPGSTGKVWTADGGEFYPSVVNCAWVL